MKNEMRSEITSLFFSLFFGGVGGVGGGGWGGGGELFFSCPVPGKNPTAPKFKHLILDSDMQCRFRADESVFVCLFVCLFLFSSTGMNSKHLFDPIDLK